jgi:NAD(P)H-dependent flavin oxidoreductase YrpB (nitropropane dioxygenase family)
MMLHTPLCDLFGIDVPIFAAPMGFITGPELAAAVSNAGGLGIMSFSANPPPVLREQIRRLRSLTNRPFGVNVLLNGPHLPFPIDAVVDVCLEEHVPVLSTFWGDPTPYVARAHAAGVKVIDQVGSVAHAQRAAQVGVDAIVAQGVEAGGHIAGEVTTTALMPRVVDAVAPLPVVAAGGIADARGLRRRPGARRAGCHDRHAADRHAGSLCASSVQTEGACRHRRPDRAHHAFWLCVAKRAAPHIAHAVCRTLAAGRGAWQRAAAR